MYSDAFCKVYNEFGWNYFPEAFAGQLLLWMEEEGLKLTSCLDLACETCMVVHLNDGRIFVISLRNAEETAASYEEFLSHIG